MVAIISNGFNDKQIGESLGIHPSDDGKKMHAKNLQKTKYGKS
jgi:hypothetical protein